MVYLYNLYYLIYCVFILYIGGLVLGDLLGSSSRGYGYGGGMGGFGGGMGMFGPHRGWGGGGFGMSLCIL